VLHVVEPLLLAPEFRSGDIEQLKVSEQQLRSHGEELVTRTEQLMRKAGFKVHALVKEGDHRGEIIDHAAEWGADLIVLGSHGRKGLNRFLMGSVAEFVPPCSLFSGNRAYPSKQKVLAAGSAPDRDS